MVSNQILDTIVMGETALPIYYISTKEKSKHFNLTATFDIQQLNSSDALLPFAGTGFTMKSAVGATLTNLSPMLRRGKCLL